MPAPAAVRTGDDGFSPWLGVVPNLARALQPTGLDVAAAPRRPAPDSPIHHSDRGVQYA